MAVLCWNGLILRLRWWNIQILCFKSLIFLLLISNQRLWAGFRWRNIVKIRQKIYKGRFVNEAFGGFGVLSVLSSPSQANNPAVLLRRRPAEKWKSGWGQGFCFSAPLVCGGAAPGDVRAEPPAFDFNFPWCGGTTERPNPGASATEAALFQKTAENGESRTALQKHEDAPLLETEENTELGQ